MPLSNEKIYCTAQLPTGNSCRKTPLPDSSFCQEHSIELSTEKIDLIFTQMFGKKDASKGGRPLFAEVETQYENKILPLADAVQNSPEKVIPKTLDTPMDILHLVHGVLALLLARRITCKIAGGASALCNTALKAMEQTKSKQREQALRVRFNSSGEFSGAEITVNSVAQGEMTSP